MTQLEMSVFTRKVQRLAIQLYARHLYINGNVPLDEIYSITNKLTPKVIEKTILNACTGSFNEEEVKAECTEWLDRRAFGHNEVTLYTRHLIALALGKDFVDSRTVSRSKRGKVIPTTVTPEALSYINKGDLYEKGVYMNRAKTANLLSSTSKIIKSVKAHHLLDTGMSKADVAAECGYSSVGSLYNTLKKYNDVDNSIEYLKDFYNQHKEDKGIQFIDMIALIEDLFKEIGQSTN